jgi:hypothetical protein
MSSKRKLTLSVDEKVIERARRYSARNRTSISQLVSTYLSQLESTPDQQFSPLVLRLRGVLPPDTEIEDYHRYLEEKHA